jgi:tetratricopeptide (TPR) repeat protein
MEINQTTKASILISQSRYELAIEALCEELDSSSDDSCSYAQLAICFYQLKKYKEAYENIVRAIELDPRSSINHQTLALILYEQKKYIEAIFEANEAIYLDPNDANAFTILSKIMVNQGQYDRALEVSEKAVELEPESIVVLLAYGEALAFTNNKSKNNDKLANVYETILSIDPKNDEAHLALGGILFRQSKSLRKKGYYHLKESLRLNPTSDYIKSSVLLQVKNGNIFFRYINIFHFRVGLVTQRRMLIYYVFICLATRLLIAFGLLKSWICFLIISLLIIELYRPIIFDVLILINPLARQIFFSGRKNSDFKHDRLLAFLASIVLIWVISGNIFAFLGTLVVLMLSILFYSGFFQKFIENSLKNLMTRLDRVETTNREREAARGG